ncbi:hypothetical protein [Ewingella americana]|uniref:Uncharacterized protein n=1 Tax=Ewingella americana TaxID=41202 RepID=A0A502GH77_9GAMM|nr:hypothetical protein [Ewingella americana]TPG60083.1 hypothetical protein EAH77_16070 [Ewingella americana]
MFMQQALKEAEIVDADFTEVEMKDITPPATKQTRTKSVLSEMAQQGVTIAELFDAKSNLADQMGIISQLASMHMDCMVCAKPRKTLEVIEEMIFLEQIPYMEVAMQFDLTVEDIEHHVKECVLNRQAAVPVGALVNRYVKELHEFTARMEKFRLELDSDMSSESIHTYLSVLSKLEGSVNNVIKMSSPDDEALQITKKVLNPLALMLFRDNMQSFNNIIEFGKVSGVIVPGREADFKERIVYELGLLTKSKLKSRFHTGILKLCELKGVDPIVVLGTSAANAATASEE